MSVDRLIIEFDKALRTVAGSAKSLRPVPGGGIQEADLSYEDRRHAAALMRVNHVGEVCAQALYQGQSIVSRNPGVRVALDKAAQEETEHLAWAEQRVVELGGRTSLLNPLWYSGALAIGIFAGILGDRWNLGFLAETERQVSAHLDDHLGRLPENDRKSRAIVAQMRADELAHAAVAVRLGGAELPRPARMVMRLASRLMTQVSYRV